MSSSFQPSFFRGELLNCGGYNIIDLQWSEQHSLGGNINDLFINFDLQFFRGKRWLTDFLDTSRADDFFWKVAGGEKNQTAGSPWWKEANSMANFMKKCVSDWIWFGFFGGKVAHQQGCQSLETNLFFSYMLSQLFVLPFIFFCFVRNSGKAKHQWRPRDFFGELLWCDLILAILCDLFVMVKMWPLQRLSDQLGNKKVAAWIGCFQDKQRFWWLLWQFFDIYKPRLIMRNILWVTAPTVSAFDAKTMGFCHLLSLKKHEILIWKFTSWMNIGILYGF